MIKTRKEPEEARNGNEVTKRTLKVSIAKASFWSLLGVKENIECKKRVWRRKSWLLRALQLKRKGKEISAQILDSSFISINSLSGQMG